MPRAPCRPKARARTSTASMGVRLTPRTRSRCRPETRGRLFTHTPQPPNPHHRLSHAATLPTPPPYSLSGGAAHAHVLEADDAEGGQRHTRGRLRLRQARWPAESNLCQQPSSAYPGLLNAASCHLPLSSCPAHPGTFQRDLPTLLVLSIAHYSHHAHSPHRQQRHTTTHNDSHVVQRPHTHMCSPRTHHECSCLLRTAQARSVLDQGVCAEGRALRAGRQRWAAVRGGI